jgi:hypothetical protein
MFILTIFMLADAEAKVEAYANASLEEATARSQG